MPIEQQTHLEPRVARLEVGLETLTKAVNDIASTMRDNNTSTNAKIDQLAVAVTLAGAPRKTDWSLFVSIGFFILALGSAVFWPLNKSTQDNKVAIEKYHDEMTEHMKLPLHPVGQARIDGMDLVRTELIARDTALDNKIQKETQLALEASNTKIADLDVRVQREFNMLNQAMDMRVGKMEKYMEHQDFADMDELKRWRLGELKK